MLDKEVYQSGVGQRREVGQHFVRNQVEPAAARREGEFCLLNHGGILMYVCKGTKNCGPPCPGNGYMLPPGSGMVRQREIMHRNIGKSGIYFDLRSTKCRYHVRYPEFPVPGGNPGIPRSSWLLLAARVVFGCC